MAANLAALEFVALIEAGEVSPAVFAAAGLAVTQEGVPLPVQSSVGEFFWDVEAGTLTVAFSGWVQPYLPGRPRGRGGARRGDVGGRVF